MKSLKNYMHIFQGVSIPWVILIAYLLVSLSTSTLFVASTTLTADIIDAAQYAINASMLIKFIGVLVGTSVATVAEWYLRNLAYERINKGVRVRLWTKLIHLPIRYYDKENGDSLVSRVTTDASQSYICFYVLIQLINTIYMAVISVVQMVRYSVQLTIPMILLLPVSLVVTALCGKLNYTVGEKTQATFAGTLAYLVERTRNLRLIKAARMERQEDEAGSQKFNAQYRAGYYKVAASGCWVIAANVISIASLFITFFLGGRLVSQGVVTVGRLTGFYTLSSQLDIRLNSLTTLYSNLKNANGRVEKISEILDTPDEKKDGIRFDVADADLVADNISFAYGERSALEHVSFRVPRGQVTAIVGSNGAGKSTMFKLFERMYDPDEGRLLFGEDDARTFAVDSWRRSFAIVDQSSPLLSGTVRENILYGVKRRVTEEELVEVAKLANVYDFVMATPGGFDAPVGMGGVNFSGGQRQCIAIARAMMRNPDYLLLDEATASLDAKSEQLVSQALTNLMAGRTTVMIAHSYPATRDATHIVVMKDGHVEAEGSPEELLETNEYYRSFAGRAGRA